MLSSDTSVTPVVVDGVAISSCSASVVASGSGSAGGGGVGALGSEEDTGRFGSSRLPGEDLLQLLWFWLLFRYFIPHVFWSFWVAKGGLEEMRLFF